MSSNAESGPYRTVRDGSDQRDVVFWNDKKTSMAFVTEVLRGIFGMVEPFATRTMLATDRQGRSVAGTFDEPEAQRLAEATLRLARERG
jgi:ATP-dependent Clp protease adapter protein ClpS